MDPGNYLHSPRKLQRKEAFMKIIIDSITKRFSDIVAVDSLNMTVGDGELVSLLGPSGCGKSTTLHILAGLLEQDEGSIYFGDRLVDRVITQKRNIGLIFQSYALYPHLSVEDNIAFPLRMNRISSTDRKKRVGEVGELLEINDLLKRKPGELSGGQQQRVAIARALIKNPDALLMDEPFSNLDKKLRTKTREEVRKLQMRLGISTVFVTHDQEEAAAISDHIALMNEGRLMQFGSPKELYHNPEHLFTARFIGDAPINEWVGIYEEGILRTVGGLSLQFIPEDECPHEIILGFRPEALAPDEASPVLVAVVESGEMLGKDILVKGNSRGETLRWFMPSDTDIRMQSSLGLRPDPERMMVFDAESHRRIHGRVSPYEN